MNYAAQANTAGIAVTPNSFNSFNDAQVSLIESSTNTIRQAAERVVQSAILARTIADAVFGMKDPATVGGKDAPSAPTSGRAESLQRAGGDLHGAISELEMQMDRLRAL